MVALGRARIAQTQNHPWTTCQEKGWASGEGLHLNPSERKPNYTADQTL